LKILILKPSSLGDVVQALPVLRLLKLHWPDSEVHWWIDSSLAPLLDGDRDLESVVRFERRRWVSPAYWPEIAQSIHWMRRQRFDLVIDLQCLARSGAFAWFARGKLLVGLDEVREGARGFYDIAVRRPSYHTHAVDWYLETLKSLKVPVHWNFDWIPPRPQVSEDLMRNWNLDAGRRVVIQPGARWLNKRWPVENYAALIREIAAEDHEVRFAVLGGDADREMGSAIARAEPGRCVDLTGRISLIEMVECIRLADLMITNDTGPMHVAAALRKPVIGIFGPTEPRRTGPYGQIDNCIQGSLPCIPCMSPICTYREPLKCLHMIAPADVLARARRFLKPS
jgi:heptosyltransferase-1